MILRVKNDVTRLHLVSYFIGEVLGKAEGGACFTDEIFEDDYRRSLFGIFVSH